MITFVLRWCLRLILAVLSLMAVSLSIAVGFIWPSLRYIDSFDSRLKRQVQEMLFSVFLLFLLSPLLSITKLPGFMFHWAVAAGLMFFSPLLPPPPVPPPPETPLPHPCYALRGAVPLWFFCSCRTLMGTCLLPLHLLPVATGSLKMTSCCLPVVSCVGL